jgi:hypothetical protein
VAGAKHRSRRTAVRWLLAVAGVGLVVTGVLIRADSTVAIAAITLGVGCFVIALLLPDLQQGEIGMIRLGFREQERDAAAEAADIETPVEELEQLIGSQDPDPPTPSAEDPSVIGVLNYAAGSLAIEAIFEWVRSRPPMVGSDLRLYLFDESEQKLRPVMDIAHAGHGEPPAWKPGQGATGTAYESGSFVLADGPAVADATFGLTPEQQERYSRLRTVAAAPIWNKNSTVIGVLTASSEDPGNQLATPEAEQELLTGGLFISRVLIDLLQWFDDDA